MIDCAQELLIMDNVLSEAEVNELEQRALSGVGFGYMDKAVYVDRFFYKKSMHHPQFVHSLFNTPHVQSTHFDMLFPLFKHLPDFDRSTLLRAKINITTHNPKFDADTCGALHTDHLLTEYMDRLYTALYYVNDSDGDTFIFDGAEGEECVLRDRIPPKKGRLVVFDGTTIHAGNCPSTEVGRAVININYFKPKNEQ